MDLIPSAREAAKLLGGEATGARVLCPGPGHSHTDRSLSVWFRPDTPDGYIVHSFAGDDPLRCKDHVRERLRLSEWRPSAPAKPSVRPAIAPDVGQNARIASALAIWRGAVNPRGTVVEGYLRSRGLELQGDVAHALRFHGGLHFEGRATCGMVALMRDVLTNEPCGVHRTFLDQGGGKLDRRMLGRAKGAAIKLDADEDVTLGLHVGEGIETCLAGQQLGYRPVWALGSAGAIAAFPVLAGIETVIVLAESDDASSRAAEACCERYEAAESEARICRPPTGDLNDSLRRVA